MSQYLNPGNQPIEPITEGTTHFESDGPYKTERNDLSGAVRVVGPGVSSSLLHRIEGTYWKDALNDVAKSKQDELDAVKAELEKEIGYKTELNVMYIQTRADLETERKKLVIQTQETAKWIRRWEKLKNWLSNWTSKNREARFVLDKMTELEAEDGKSNG